MRRQATALAGGARAPRGDAELLAAIAAGDVVALGQLYDRHARDVWRAVRRATNDSPDSEDLVHATFLKLPRIAASFDGRVSCRAWLSGVAVNEALHHNRGFRRLRNAVAGLARAIQRPPAADPEVQASRNQDVAALDRALASLTPKKRAVFALVELEGMAQESVAVVLGIPPATVRTRLHNAKREIRIQMKGREGQ